MAAAVRTRAGVLLCLLALLSSASSIGIFNILLGGGGGGSRRTAPRLSHTRDTRPAETAPRLSVTREPPEPELSVVPYPDREIQPDPALQQFLVSTFSCDKKKSFNLCVSEGTESLISTVGSGLTLALVTGELPETKLGPLVVSARNLDIQGLDTLRSTDVVVQGNTLYMTVLLDRLELEGDFTLKVPLLGRFELHLVVKARGLRAPAALVLSAGSGRLQRVEDFNMKAYFDSFDIELNRGGPLVASNVPLSGLINGVVTNFIKGLRDKSTLENKILPGVVKLLKPTLLDLLNRFLESQASPKAA